MPAACADDLLLCCSQKKIQAVFFHNAPYLLTQIGLVDNLVGNFSCFFEKILSGIPSECQTV